MATELEKLLGEDKKEVTPPSEEKKPEEKPEVTPPEKNPEVKAKAEHLANLSKAVVDEEARLKEIRRKQKLAKQGIIEDEEEEIPVIDDKDPNAKAWNKRINDAAAPAQQELEKAKQERRLFTLRQFLTDKPSLAKNPERIKSMMETYDKLKTSTELTSEGILMDLEKAYAAEHSEELISAARDGRVENARNDAIFSDIAVSRGSTAYQEETPKKRVYSDEEKDILKQWERSGAPKVE